MNYLFCYLQLLSHEELALLETLDLAPRQRSVLDALIDVRGEKDAARETILSGLGLSASHFDKICSLLLRRVYDTIVPDGGRALLYDLNRRSLQANFLHELHRQERDVAAGSVEARAGFYLECFNLLGRISRKDYNGVLMAELARKYGRLCPSPDNAIFFEADMVCSLIWNAAARGTNDEVRQEAERRLRRNAARIVPDTGPLALYKQYQAYALFHAQIDENPSERLGYLQLAAELCDRHPDLFSEDERVLALCRIAESYYFNSHNFGKAYRLYASLFRKHRRALARDYYHTTKFIQLCIICGRYGRAERLLRERFDQHLASEHESIGTMGAISWAKLLLVTGRVAEAKPYIDFGYQRNRKNLYIQYEIELRMLESAYFVLTGEREFADQLAVRNMKYLRSKGYLLANARFYPWFFKLLRVFLDERPGGGKLTPELQQKIVEFDEGPAALYGILLRLARDSSAPVSC